MQLACVPLQKNCKKTVNISKEFVESYSNLIINKLSTHLCIIKIKYIYI